MNSQDIKKQLQLIEKEVKITKKCIEITKKRLEIQKTHLKQKEEEMIKLKSSLWFEDQLIDISNDIKEKDFDQICFVMDQTEEIYDQIKQLTKYYNLNQNVKIFNFILSYKVESKHSVSKDCGVEDVGWDKDCDYSEMQLELTEPLESIIKVDLNNCEEFEFPCHKKNCDNSEDNSEENSKYDVESDSSETGLPLSELLIDDCCVSPKIENLKFEDFTIDEDIIDYDGDHHGVWAYAKAERNVFVVQIKK
jgi:hypothetical protein